VLSDGELIGDYILLEILGMSTDDIAELERNGVL
jgi:hypothetical protein